MNTKDQFVRLWRNEVTRVFVDRLITEEDRVLLVDTVIPSMIKEHFNETYDNAMVNPLLFGDYLLANPNDPDHVDPKLYEDCGDYEKVGVKFN